MRIRAFDGASGDCVLLTSTNGRNILVDGGLVRRQFGTVLSYQHNVAPEMAAMRDRGERLDLICVSHVDQDHIGGILSMLNDEFEWRVYEHQTTQGLNPRQPDGPRPPEIDGIWHNAFHEQIGQSRRELGQALNAAAKFSLAQRSSPLSHGHNLFEQLATSLKEAAQVSRRLGAKQLNIPLNAEFDGKLVRRRSRSKPVALDDLMISVLGPTSSRLIQLQDKWNNWLQAVKGKKQIEAVRRKAEEDEQLLLEEGLQAYLALSEFGPAVGNRNDVTVQNIASIVMMIEEGGKRALFTGDARDDDIYDDLVAGDYADSDGHIHLDLLKVQHHGSENNFSLDFAQKVTADHYLFCGNGGHHNPDLGVVKALLDARVGAPPKRSPHITPDRPFKLWFTSDGTTYAANKGHMEKVQNLVSRRLDGKQHAAAYFSADPHFDINL